MAYTLNLTHIDTCLSCYVLDHCNRDGEMLFGLAIDKSSRVYQVKGDLIDSVTGRNGDDMTKMPDDMTDEMLISAVNELFKGAHPLKSFDSSLDKASDDGESCYAWFRLTWEPVETDDAPEAASIAPQARMVAQPVQQAQSCAATVTADGAAFLIEEEARILADPTSPLAIALAAQHAKDSAPTFPAFGRYVCSGESVTVEVDGFTLTATVHDDDNETAPWDREDGHGPVTGWESRDKAPGERILNEDHGSKRFYDMQEATKIARRDGWGPRFPHRTDGQAIAAAVESDFQALRAWCNDDWRYCGVSVTVEFDGITLVNKYEVSCWGVEMNYPGSNNAHLSEVANELLIEALDAARSALASVVQKACA